MINVKPVVSSMGRSLFLISAVLLIIQSPALSNEKGLFDLSLEEVMNITVATKTELSVEEAPSIVSVITDNEIRNMGARNLTDVLRTIPGVEIDHSASFWNNEINMRGIRNTYSSKVKLMLNGHTVYGWIYTFSPYQLIDTISVNSIKRIEIIRGPGSALYGAGAFTGAINIITKEGGKDPSEISVAVGSYDTYHPAAQISFKNNDFKLFAYADHFKTSGYDGTVQEDMATNEAIFGSAAPGKMTSEQEYSYLHTQIAYKRFSCQGMVIKLESEVPIGVVRVLTDENKVEDLSSFIELRYELPIGDKAKVYFKTAYDYSDNVGLYEIFPEETGQLHNELTAGGNFSGLPWPEGQGLMASPSHTGQNYSAEATVDYEVFSSLRLVGGISYEHSKLNDTKHLISFNVTGQPMTINGVTYQPFPYTYLGGMVDVTESYNWIDEKNCERSITALYIQGTVDLKEIFHFEKGVNNLALTLGIRHDNYDDFGSTTNPRAGLVYGPNEKLYFKLLYGQAFRAPNFSELYNQNNPTTNGNPDIKSETIDTIEFLMGYNFTDRIRSSITYFDFNIEDVVQIVTAGVGGMYENIGSYEGRGVEAEIKFMFNKYRYLYFNFTYQDVEDTSNKTIVSEGGQYYTHTNFNPGSIPEFYGNLGINYDVTDWMIGNISMTYIGETGRSEEMSWNEETLVAMDSREAVDSYLLLNGAVTFKNFYNGLEFQLSGFNLLDEDHRSPDPEVKITYDFPHSGQTFMAKLSYVF